MAGDTSSGERSGGPPGDRATRTHCPYCAFQCGMELAGPPEGLAIRGDPASPLNQGQLCVKGFTAGATLAHRERLLEPLARDGRGELVPVSWDEALAYAVARSDAGEVLLRIEDPGP